MDGDFVEAFKALRLRDSVVDHHRVDILHVGDADELVDRRIVALVALQRRILALPLLMRLAKQRNV